MIADTKKEGAKMVVGNETDIFVCSVFVCSGKFAPEAGCNGIETLYKFRRANDQYFYLTREGLRSRLRKLQDLGRAHDQTSKAAELLS